jgi:hypothetical protein
MIYPQLPVRTAGSFVESDEIWIKKYHVNGRRAWYLKQVFPTARIPEV